MDVDAAHSGRRLGVEYSKLSTGEIDVLAVERAQLADAQTREREGRDDRAEARHGPLCGALGVVDGGRLCDVELGGDRLPSLARRAHPDDPAAQLVARSGALVELARRVDERHRLVELEPVLLLAADLEAEVFSFGGVAWEQSLAHGAREDLREQVQVGVDRLRTQRLHRSPTSVDERLADCERCLDAAVLCELSVEVGLDVAARQLAHDDVTEVRQQVDLELALDVGQAAWAESLSNFAL